MSMNSRHPDCEKFRPMLHEFADGTLGEAEKASVEAHLMHCRRCQRRVEALRAMAQALSSMPLQPAPTGFEQRLRQKMQERGLLPAPKPILRQPFARLRAKAQDAIFGWLEAFAFAVAVALLLGLILLRLGDATWALAAHAKGTLSSFASAAKSLPSAPSPPEAMEAVQTFSAAASDLLEELRLYWDTLSFTLQVFAAQPIIQIILWAALILTVLANLYLQLRPPPLKAQGGNTR